LNHSDSPSPVDITDDSIINFDRHADEISFVSNCELNPNEENENTNSITPKTIREEKLLAVSRLFQLCYRTVIPNRQIYYRKV
jgi:hypothetical protein